MTPTAVAKWEDVFSQALRREQPLVLYGVSWDEYAELMEAYLDKTNLRFTYYNGVLKIMGQGTLHENISSFLHSLVTITALFFRIKTISVGSMTLMSKRHGKGAEPDQSFYVKNAGKLKIKKTLYDHEKDTPPDLVIEVDESHKSDDKFAIYADFGIKEFWRYDEKVLKMYELDELGVYQEIEKSISFPVLTTGVPNDFLNHRESKDEFEALLDFESWLQKQIEQN